jgi:phosphatidylinositol glycan class W
MRSKCIWLLAIIFGVGYQYALGEFGLEQWIIANDDDNYRQSLSLIAANREGICSLFGYLSIYFASIEIGIFMTTTG